ncbi:unnamed protein product [Sphagnum troendelagicum]|uniref:LAGLIDADG homing endonuclease n=1 Tax=Sphagnum troendelagicum TaxID=128251 RepID=A0ABP0UR89_9BRYO
MNWRVGFYGLQELCWPYKGDCNVYAQPSVLARPWMLVWFGQDAQHAEQGVGLLMAPKWADALLFFDQHSPYLISVYVSVRHRFIEHRLLVLSLQLSLKARPHVALGKGLWDGEALYVPKKLGLSPATFKLIIAKKVAHLAKLGADASPVSKVANRAANATIKKIVAHDVNAYLKQQAHTASCLRRQGRIGD